MLQLARVCSLTGGLCCKAAGCCFLYYLEADTLVYWCIVIVVVNNLQCFGPTAAKYELSNMVTD